jgi:predicted secreted protein
MTEIALAYSSIDKARAEAIGKVLGALGYKLTPQPLTQAGVEQAKALVVFWSSGSVN